MSSLPVTLKYPKMIEKTVEKESQARLEKIPELQAYLEGIRSSRLGLQQRYQDPATNLTEEEYRKRLASYDLSLDKAATQMRGIQLAERAKEESLATYMRSSQTVYNNANKVLSKTGKNRLYLGNRQEVAALVDGKEDKKKRILDAGVWSWDVNFAWLEGGMHAKAHFKLKSELPDSVKEAIRDSSNHSRVSNLSARQFKVLCEGSEPAPGKAHSDLWQSAEGRLTWYALEIMTLLDNGYRFRWATKDKDTKIRFYLEKPQ